MDIRPIKTEADYEFALAEIEGLLEAAQVDLGLARAGDPHEQDRRVATRGDGLADRIDRGLLLVVEVVSRVRSGKGPQGGARPRLGEADDQALVGHGAQHGR